MPFHLWRKVALACCRSPPPPSSVLHLQMFAVMPRASTLWPAPDRTFRNSRCECIQISVTIWDCEGPLTNEQGEQLCRVSLDLQSLSHGNSIVEQNLPPSAQLVTSAFFQISFPLFGSCCELFASPGPV